MFERVADGCRRQRNVALCQSQQGESRLRIPPRLSSPEERFLRTFEITQLESRAAQFGKWPAELPAQVRSQFRLGQEPHPMRHSPRPCTGRYPGQYEVSGGADVEPGARPTGLEKPCWLALQPRVAHREPGSIVAALASDAEVNPPA